VNAREIVNLLLEADLPSAGDSTGVYVFGPGLPKEGYSTPSVETAVEEFRKYGLIDPNTRDDVGLMGDLVGQGYTFFLKKAPGDIEVIGAVPARTTPEGQDRAAQYLGLENHERVQYRRTPTSTPTSLSVDQVLYGSKEAEAKEQETKERAAQKREATAKKKRSTFSKYFGYIDPEEEGWQSPETGVGYQQGEEMMPLNAPVEIGMTFDRGSEDGIHVEEVHPAGPAAQAGLQAGDVIVQVGKFARNDGKEPKAYAIENPRHLEYVLKVADPQYPIPFRVIRGDGEYWMPILPNQKAAPKEQGIHVPAAELQAQGQPQPAPAQAGEPTKPQGYPAPKPGRAKQMVLGLRGTKPKNPQRRLPLKYPPNAPTPSRETGNPPANVSSVT